MCGKKKENSHRHRKESATQRLLNPNYSGALLKSATRLRQKEQTEMWRGKKKGARSYLTL